MFLHNMGTGKSVLVRLESDRVLSLINQMMILSHDH